MLRNYIKTLTKKNGRTKTKMIDKTIITIILIILFLIEIVTVFIFTQLMLLSYYKRLKIIEHELGKDILQFEKVIKEFKEESKTK